MKKLMFAFLQVGLMFCAHTTFATLSNGGCTAGDLVPCKTNAAYLYYTYHGSKQPDSIWNNAINLYNSNANANSKINLLYPYASDLEFGSHGANNPYGYAFYYGGKTQGYVQTYKNTVPSANIAIIVDGSTNFGGALYGFDQMTPANAKLLADLVANGNISGNPNTATGVCNDPNVAGVALDIEPFYINSDPNSGSYNFYSEIAKDLANCNKYFSVFAFANMIDQTAANVLNSYHNGYVIDSTYDVPYDAPNNHTNLPAVGDGTNIYYFCNTGTSGQCADPSQAIQGLYTPANPQLVDGFDRTQGITTYNAVVPHPLNYEIAAVTAEANKMVAVANQYGVKFQFAIPASGATHEFETWCVWNVQEQSCESSLGNYNGTSQLDYIKAMVPNVFNKALSQLKDPTLFRGMAIWTWIPQVLWSPDGTNYVALQPNIPDNSTQSYLATELGNVYPAALYGTGN